MGNGGPVRILNVFLVEDSPVIRDHLHADLPALGCVAVVGHAQGAQEAIQALRETRVDVILLDLRLAEGHGLQVLADVKQTSPWVVVIVLTNHAGQSYRERCLRLRVDHFFDRSREWPQMLQAIQQARDALGGTE
jgi:DNA-binding NarL/FixJ family response regulator